MTFTPCQPLTENGFVQTSINYAFGSR
jgi:hypothetical protein